MMKRISLLLALIVGFVLVGCATEPIHPIAGCDPAVSEKAADTAVTLIGKPYKYRGIGPQAFDCSGLVRYCYLAAGRDVPHSTKELKNATSPIGLPDIRKGDLLFFKERGRRYSHVGIYLEEDIFVHAPGKRQKVRKDSLQDPHWQKTFIEARRFP